MNDVCPLFAKQVICVGGTDASQFAKKRADVGQTSFSFRIREERKIYMIRAVINMSSPLLLLTLSVWAISVAKAELPEVTVQIIEGGESKVPAADIRRMLVGPGVNQPDPHPGYTGFVGWESPLRLRDGTLLVGFSTGYWHASPPTAAADARRPVETLE